MYVHTQVHEQQAREQTLCAKLQQARAQHAASCRNAMELEARLEQTQVGAREVYVLETSVVLTLHLFVRVCMRVCDLLGLGGRVGW